MFIIFNKDKILSYLISISTVTILLVLSFAITKNNEEILRTSTNAVINNQLQEQDVTANETQNRTVNSNKGQAQNTLVNSNKIQEQNTAVSSNQAQKQNIIDSTKQVNSTKNTST